MLTIKNNASCNDTVKRHAFYRKFIGKLILFKVLAMLLFMTVSGSAQAQCTNFTQAQNWTSRTWCGSGDGGCTSPGRQREYAIYDGKVWTPNYSSTNASLNSSWNRGYGSTTYWGYAAECEVAPPPPNHYRIEHDGQGITGVDETVTLKACADANCTSLSSGSTSITLDPSTWNGSNPITSSTGSSNVTFSRSAAGTITFSKSNNSSATPDAPLRCFNGNTETCNFVVSDGGGGSCPADSYGIYGLEEIEVKGYFTFNGETVSDQKKTSNSAIDLNGDIVTPSPAIVLPTLPAITFVNSPDANGSLSPGNYGEWTVNEGAAVTMAPGIYNIDEVDIKDDAIITISPAGPVIINVNKFDMDDGSRLNANVGASAANLTVNYYGISSNNDNKFHLHDDVHFTGIIFSSYDDDKVEVKKAVEEYLKLTSIEPLVEADFVNIDTTTNTAGGKFYQKITIKQLKADDDPTLKLNMGNPSNFSEVKDHQLEALKAVSGSGLTYKIDDSGYGQKPFDSFALTDSKSFSACSSCLSKLYFVNPICPKRFVISA